MYQFDIQWIISPEIPGGSSSVLSYNVPPFSLEASSLYIVSVTMTHIEHNSIAGIESDFVKTEAPPKGGIFEINPMSATMGEVLTA